METISYSIIRQNLANAMDRVCDKHDLIIITRKSAKPVVMMSLDDYNALEETIYLLKSPNNAKKLRQSIKEFEEGKIITRDLIE
jgi:antitoxin YefM